MWSVASCDRSHPVQADFQSRRVPFLLVISTPHRIPRRLGKDYESRRRNRPLVCHLHCPDSLEMEVIRDPLWNVCVDCSRQL